MLLRPAPSGTCEWEHLPYTALIRTRSLLALIQQPAQPVPRVTIQLNRHSNTWERVVEAVQRARVPVHRGQPRQIEVLRSSTTTRSRLTG